MINKVSLATIFSIQSYYNIIDHIYCTIYYTFMTYFFITESLYLLIPFIISANTLTALPFGDHLFVSCIYESVA